MSLSDLDWTNWDISGVTFGKAFVSEQKGETCVRHALGKGIFEFLQKIDFFDKECTEEELKVKQQIVIDKVLDKELDGVLDKNAEIDPLKFDDESIVLDASELNPLGAQEPLSLKMQIVRAQRNREAFADENQWASFKGDDSNFLIIGCDTSYFTDSSANDTTLHAVYVKDYDVESQTFNCINSWGPAKTAKPFPEIRDADQSIKSFHVFGVHLVEVSGCRDDKDISTSAQHLPRQCKADQRVSHQVNKRRDLQPSSKKKVSS